MNRQPWLMMAEIERECHEVLVGVEQRILEGLAGVDALLNPVGGGAGGFGLRTIVAERQIRELARRAGDDVLDLLARGGELPVDDQRLGAALLHTSHALGAMCDESVDLTRLAVPAAVSDAYVADALASMRHLTQGQLRTVAEALAARNGELASGVRAVHTAVGALNHEIVERALVAEDGAVRREDLGAAVLAAECLTRISEHAADVGEHLVRVIDPHPLDEPHSPV